MGPAKRLVISPSGSSSPIPTTVAAMKLSRNSVPIVGTVENMLTVYSSRWSAPVTSTARAPTTTASWVSTAREFAGI